jgi:hypothetical protein
MAWFQRTYFNFINSVKSIMSAFNLFSFFILCFHIFMIYLFFYYIFDINVAECKSLKNSSQFFGRYQINNHFVHFYKNVDFKTAHSIIQDITNSNNTSFKYNPIKF